jgi:hypothetical protein
MSQILHEKPKRKNDDAMNGFCFFTSLRQAVYSIVRHGTDLF